MKFFKHNILKTPRSLFFHLVFTMLSSAAIIFFVLFGFFHYLDKQEDHPFKHHIDMYASFLADATGHPPSKDKALLLSRKLQLAIGFEGKNNNWKTDLNIPSSQILATFIHDPLRKTGRFHHSFFKIIKTTEGTFVFLIDSKMARPWPIRAFLSLFLLLLGILFVAWWTLRKSLLPVKKLEKAFADIASGNLDTKLEIKHPREFSTTAAGFNAMIDRIREMIVLRETMLRDVSHELRSPLTRIKLAMQFIPASKDKTSIEEDVHELENLIGEILETSGIDKNQPEDMITTDLSKIIQQAIANFQERTKDFIIQAEFPNENCFIKGNETKLLRVFNNLLENSLKYGRSPLTIKVQRTNASIIIELMDQGRGIHPNNLERVFAPFFQENTARTPGGKGYGLGLYLVRKIITMHGGTISAVNKDNRTSFVIEIPIV